MPLSPTPTVGAVAVSGADTSLGLTTTWMFDSLEIAETMKVYTQ